jgi:hypothetical protein
MAFYGFSKLFPVIAQQIEQWTRRRRPDPEDSNLVYMYLYKG